MKATLLYTLIRLGLFAVIFAVLSFTPMSIFLSAAIAAVIALLVSYIFLGRLRSGVAETIVRRRAAPERDDDADLEDAVLDGSASAGPGFGGAASGGPHFGGPSSGGPASGGPAAGGVGSARPAPVRRAAPPAEDD